MHKINEIEVLGCKVSAVDADGALKWLEHCLIHRVGGYVCFANVHNTVLAKQNDSYRKALNTSLLTLADGMPIYWHARRKAPIDHLPGPDFMKYALVRFKSRKHFLYGATPFVIAKLEDNLRREYPGLNICGSLSPPFREISQAEKEQHYRAIRHSGAEFVWVGLGAPKQERWMFEATDKLKDQILFGVGAAFDFHAGTVARAPEILRKSGLEWIYRLIRQPKRLWRRYLVTNTLFLFYLAVNPLNKIFRFPFLTRRIVSPKRGNVNKHKNSPGDDTLNSD